MPRKVTVTFEDGSQHVYDNVPDNVTPDQVLERVGADFPDLVPTKLDRSPASGATAPKASTPTKAPSTPNVAQAQEPQTPLSPLEQGAGVEEIITKERRNIPGLNEELEALYRSGERRAEAFNEVLKRFGVNDNQFYRQESIDDFTRRVEKRGVLPSQVFAPVTVETGEKDPEPAEGILENFGQGAARAATSSANTLTALAGLAAELVGDEETANRLLKNYLKTKRGISLEYGQTPDIENVGSVGDFLDYLAGVTGELAPDLATGMIGGLAGRAIGKKLAGNAAQEIVERRAMQGAILGAAVPSVAQETGATFGDTYGATGEKAPLSSIAAGVAAGSLDAILPLKALKDLGGEQLVNAFKRSFLEKAVREGGKDFAIEGATEALQEFITSLPEAGITGKLPDDIVDRMTDAFINGGFGGAVIGVGTAGAQSIAEGFMPEQSQRARSPLPGTNRIQAPTAARSNRKEYAKQLKTAVTQAQEVANEITSAWTNAPSEVKVLPNFNKEPGVSNTAIGVYTGDGRVLINLETAAKHAARKGMSVDDVVASALFHEALGHHGLTQTFGQELDNTLAIIAENANAALAERIDAWLKKHPKSYTQGDPNGVFSPEEYRRIRALEEIMAEEAEKDGVISRSIIDKIADLIKRFARQMGFNWKYSSREIRSILSLAQQTVISGEATGQTPGANKMMYIGPKGVTEQAIRRPYDKEVGDTLTNLEIFEDFDKDPAFTEEQKSAFGVLRRYTGWFKGPDGRLRFEISDHDARLQNLNELQTKGSTRLATILDHPTLYRFYPRLRDVKVNFARDASYLAGYNTDTNEIMISGQLLNKRNKDGVLGALLHEIQHAIQLEEDFSLGSAVALAVMHMPDKIFLRMVKDYTSAPDFVVPKDVRPLMAEAFKEAAKTGDLTKLRLVFAANKDFAFEAYENVFGEVEARDVEARQKLTPDEREAIDPYTTAPNFNPRYMSMVFAGDFQKLFTAAKEAWQENEDTVKSANKYMEGDGPLDPEDFTADDLIQIDDAMKILKRVFADYDSKPVPIDTIIQGLSKRDLRPSEVARLARISPGELTRKSLRFDIAAVKLQEKTLAIIQDIRENGLTEEKQKALIEAQDTLAAIAHQVFDLGSEFGRALNAQKRVTWSRRKAQKLYDYLKKTNREHLADPEQFARYMAELENRLKNDTQDRYEIPLIGKSIPRSWLSVWNTPRSLMSSYDLSAPLRQGLLFVGNKEWINSFGKMIESLGPSGEETHSHLMRSIARDPNYDLMVIARLQFSDMDGKLGDKEENFQSDLAEKIPGVRMSERAYTVFLNKLRADVFNKYIELFKGLKDKNGNFYIETDEDGNVVRDNKGYPKVDAEFLQALGRFINSATGRAELIKPLRSMGPQLGTLFFSPRLMQSRINILSYIVGLDYIGEQLGLGVKALPWPIRKQLYKETLKTGGIVALTMGLMMLMAPDDEEVSVENDPRSPDFLKLKIGDVRYDLLGGFSQYLVFATHFALWSTNKVGATDIDEKKASTSGNTSRLEKTLNPTTESMGDRTWRFIRSKLSPNASLIVDALEEEDVVGRPFTLDPARPNSSVTSRLMPLHVQSMVEIAKQEGVERGIIMSAPGVFGVGVQAYLPPSRDPDQWLEAPDRLMGAPLRGDNKEWYENTLNNYFQALVPLFLAESGFKEFRDLPEKAQEEIISRAKDEARKLAKQDAEEYFEAVEEEGVDE